MCRAVDHDCTIIFEYEYDDENNIKLVRAQKAKICSEGPDVWGKVVDTDKWQIFDANVYVMIIMTFLY